LAICRPMPREAPVTIATLPSKLISESFFLLLIGHAFLLA
jgi:hypothetical protein